MSATEHEITLVVPCFQAVQYLAETLEACLAQTLAPREILVVDDGSTDGTGKVLSQYPVRVVRHRKNRGLARARNTGLEAVETSLVAFVDADARPCPDFLALAVEELVGSDIVGVGGRGIERAEEKLPDRWRSHFWQQTLGNQRIDNAWMVTGLCCAFKTRPLREIGGFDPRYHRTGEDIDASLRLRAHGGRLVYQPAMCVYHDRRDTWLSLIDMVAGHSYGQVAALRRNGVSARRQHANALKWLFVSTGSSLRRHRSPALAAASVPLSIVALVAQLRARSEKD